MIKWLIILIILPLACLSQENNVTGTLNNEIGQLNGAMWYLNTLDVGNVLKLKASSISEESLTYNSSGDLVLYSNADTVVLDGSTEVVIGNSIRFGTPLSGTIYQVLDTLGSADSLILNQSFTGSVTDEYYWGGVNTWDDESGKNNNAIQTTALSQPKLVNDTASIKYDGVDDYLFIVDADNLSFGNGVTDRPFSISVWVKIEELINGTILGKHPDGVTAREYKLFILGTGQSELIFAVYDQSENAFLGKRDIFLTSHLNEWVHITTTYDGVDINGINIYVNNLITTPTDLEAQPYTAMENTTTPVNIGGFTSNHYFSGEIDDIYIFSKVLTDRERTIIYENSSHYTP